MRIVGKALLLWLGLALLFALLEGAPFGYGTVAATMAFLALGGVWLAAKGITLGAAWLRKRGG